MNYSVGVIPTLNRKYIYNLGFGVWDLGFWFCSKISSVGWLKIFLGFGDWGLIFQDFGLVFEFWDLGFGV